MASSGSLKEYLKRYESNGKDEENKKKKKSKKKLKAKPVATGVLVVDEDPIWKKPVVIEDEIHSDSADEEKPQVNEDIEVKRMRRLEEISARRAYNAISDDGSGWVTLSPKRSNMDNLNSDLSPPRKRMGRNDTPSPKADLSPPRKRTARNDTPSPKADLRGSGSGEDDLSPPRQRQRQHLVPSRELDAGHVDFSPPRRGRARNDRPSPEINRNFVENVDLSPPRRRRDQNDNPSPERGRRPGKEIMDLSPPRRGRARNDSPSSSRERKPGKEDVDLSPPWQRRKHQRSTSPELGMRSQRSQRLGNDISPQRRRRRVSPVQTNVRASPNSDLSTPRINRDDDLSPPRKIKNRDSVPAAEEQRKTGLITAREMKEEISKTKKKDWIRFQEMDPSISGRHAEPVYRDKIKGNRITKEEFMKSRQKAEEKPKEIKLEWGKGLAQKREAEARLQEIELEKDKPFARTRDDPDLDQMLKSAVRWGDPMAHLVKKKKTEPVLPNLGDDERMKESGFVIPQDIPNHSWIKRGLDAAPNRYGIKPGRHWDGVDRSNGYEKESFKRTNEKQATEREAYLWSVADM